MAKIIVFNNPADRMEIFYRDECDPMPYSYQRTLLVREFRGSSNSDVLWTSKLAMDAWNTTRRAYGRGIPVGFAFKRIWEGGHSDMSQHYAGVSFDVGQTLSYASRERIYRLAIDLGVWGYVEPISLTPTWVHFDRRRGTPACSTGYPTQRLGSLSNYVLVLQDALGALGYDTNGLDGNFGRGTYDAVKSFQRQYGLTADGIVGCNTWRKLTSLVNGAGRSTTRPAFCFF